MDVYSVYKEWCDGKGIRPASRQILSDDVGIDNLAIFTIHLESRAQGLSLGGEYVSTIDEVQTSARVLSDQMGDNE